MAGVELFRPQPRLEIPENQPKVPQLDFTPLNQIGNTIVEGQRRQKITEAIARSTGPNGQLDFERAGAELAKIPGALEEARPFLALAQQKAALAQSAGQHAATLAESSRHNQATEGIATRALDEKGQLKQVDDPWGGPASIYRIEPSGKSTLVLGPGIPGGSASAPAPGSTAPIVPNVVPTESIPARPVPPVTSMPAASPIPTAPAAAAAESPAAVPPVPVTKLTGEDFLKASVPPQAQDLIRKIAAYEVDPRTLSIRGGHRETLLRAVAQFDPTYDQTQYPARGKAVTNFNAGQEAKTLRNFDVAIDHLGVLEKAAAALKNADYPAFNRIANTIKTNLGYEAPGNFNAVKSIVGDELVKAILGSGGGALGDREEIKRTINNANSPEQLAGVIKGYKDLMGGQVRGLKKQYVDTTGQSAEKFDKRLSEHTKEVLGITAPATESALPKVTNRDDANAAIAAAKAAIKQGADPKAVNEKLRQMGVPPIAGP